MSRKQWVLLMLAVGFLVFLFLDLRVRIGKERQKRVKNSQRIQRIRGDQRTLQAMVRSDSRSLKRMRKRLYFSGGGGEIRQFIEPVDPELVELGRRVSREIVVDRERERQAFEEARRGGEAPRVRVPEKEIQDAAQPLRDGTLTEAAFHDLFFKVLYWGDVGLGVQTLEQLKEENEGNRLFHYFLAQAHLILARVAVSEGARYEAVEDALEQLDTVLSLDPDHARARLQRGFYVANLPLALGRIQEGISDLKQLLDDETAGAGVRGEAALHLGVAYLKLGWSAKAAETFRRGSAVDPDSEALQRWVALMTGGE